MTQNADYVGLISACQELAAFLPDGTETQGPSLILDRYQMEAIRTWRSALLPHIDRSES